MVAKDRRSLPRPELTDEERQTMILLRDVYKHVPVCEAIKDLLISREGSVSFIYFHNFYSYLTSFVCIAYFFKIFLGRVGERINQKKTGSKLYTHAASRLSDAPKLTKDASKEKNVVEP